MKEEKKLNIKVIIMAIICLCLFSISIVPRGLQNDTFYTIKLGELILENGIDMQEHFAWHEGLPYTYPHWLYDVIMYLIYAIGGFNGIYVSTIIFTMILGVVIYLVNVKITKKTLLPFIITTIILYIGKDFITARAQLVTFIFFVLEIYFIEKFLETSKKRYIVGLLIIPALIANIHAAVFPFYFVLYLPYIGEYVVSLLVGKNLFTKLLLVIDKVNIKSLEKKSKLNEKQTRELETLKLRVARNEEKLEHEKTIKKESYKIIIEKNKNVKRLIIIMLIAAFTGLLTPIGDTPYTYLYNTMKGTTTQNINEHLPIVLYEAKYVFTYIVVAVLLIAFTKVKVKLSDLFLLGGMIFLTIMSRRQQSMLFFVGVIVISKVISQIIDMYINTNDKINILKYVTSIIGGIVVFGMFISFSIALLNKTKDIQIISKDEYPIEATEYVINNLDIQNIKLFNEYNFGSYLLFKDIPVFIDSRADVYDPAFNGWEDDIFRDFINLKSGSIDYESKFEYYGITHLLIYTDSILEKCLELDNNYKELYSDVNFIVYERLSAN